jgi:hypothetical protein
MSSNYTTKKGIMTQLNLAITKETLDKFNTICQGDSKSVVFSQLVREAYLQNLAKVQPQATAKRFNILGQ